MSQNVKIKKQTKKDEVANFAERGMINILQIIFGMKNKKTLIIGLFLIFSCNTVKNNEKKRDTKITDPLENTCWSIDYELMNNSKDTIIMEMKINLQFKENDICNISGMPVPYEYVEGGFYLAGDYFRIIDLSEKKLKVAKYWRERVTHIEVYHRIDCDSVNEIFKGFYLIHSKIKQL